MCVCMYVCVRVLCMRVLCMHVCARERILVCRWIERGCLISVCTCECVCVCVRVRARACVCLCAHTHPHACTHARIHNSIVSASIVHTRTHAHTQLYRVSDHGVGTRGRCELNRPSYTQTWPPRTSSRRGSGLRPPTLGTVCVCVCVWGYVRVGESIHHTANHRPIYLLPLLHPQPRTPNRPDLPR